MTNNYSEQAKSVLQSNWTGEFTKPAPHLYPHQWNWDSGFIALGYSHFDEDSAKKELRHLFKGQWANGMLPQIQFKKESGISKYFPGADFWQTSKVLDKPKNVRTSGITMPPVHGFILWHMANNVTDKQSFLPFIREMFPKIKRLHQYLYVYRDLEKEGLPYIRHPWSSGTDNSPVWDDVMNRIEIDRFELPTYERKDLQNKKAKSHRPTDADYDRYVYLVDLFRKNNYNEELLDQLSPFKVQDPLFIGILNYSNECMVKLAEIIDVDATPFINWRNLTTKGLNSKLWNESNKRYDAYDLVNHQRLSNFTCNSFIPLLSGAPSVERAQQMLQVMFNEHLNNQDHYPCPSFALNQEKANYEKYWRGPVWININWMLYLGCKRYGFTEAATAIRDGSIELIEKFGFHEYFDPRKSILKNGYGTDNFSWSAALYLEFINS